jgi:sugar phosphate isomerase/epimerase
MTFRYEVIKHVGIKEWFGHILRMTSDSKVSFLIENPTTEPYKAKSGESFLRFVRDLNNPRVRCCFDLCHYNVGHFLLGDLYKMPNDLGEYTFSVHFSSLPIKEHLFEPNTHGRCHKTKEDLLKDLNTLKNTGIDLDTVYIVTEINENDYINKPDLIHELQLLTEIIKGE